MVVGGLKVLIERKEREGFEKFCGELVLLKLF